MDLTITVDDEVLASARRVALEQGTSVQELIREYLASLTLDSESQRRALAASLVEHMNAHPANPGDFKWNREDAYEERLKRWSR